jgi:ADP-ribose pyrophosphatase YjhB (NUDIX family)
MQHAIRVSAAAAVVREGGLLLVEFDEPGVGLHYNLPGGGHEAGEALRETARREVREETCAEIEVGRLLLVAEYEPLRGGERRGTEHKLILVFAGTLLPGSEARLPEKLDPFQIGVRWVPLAELDSVRLLPEFGRELVAALAGEGGQDLYDVL